jgi:GT2 family glycosyltransferase
VPQTRPTLCIVNHNGARFLPTTLRAASELAHQFAEILLIDNASTDDSVALAERDFPHVRVHRMPDNLGPGAMRNTALKIAVSDVILIIDSDVTVTPDCAPTLVKALAERPTAAIAAPRVLYAHQPDIIQYDGAGSHFLGVMTLENADTPVAEADLEVRTTLSVITCAFLVDRRRLPEDEPFDVSFFIYQEDHDFGVRMRALGVDIISVPRAYCFHREGTPGLSIRALGKYSSRRVFCLIRNRWQFIFKNYSTRSLLVLAPMLILYELAQLAIVLRRGWQKEWWQAVTWMVQNVGAVHAKRADHQQRRKRPDRELIADAGLPFRSDLAGGRWERTFARAFNATASAYWRVASVLI